MKVLQLERLLVNERDVSTRSSDEEETAKEQR